jgi:uncharacterized protein
MTGTGYRFETGDDGVLRAGRWRWLRALGWMATLLAAMIAMLSLQSVVHVIFPDDRVRLAMAFVSTALAYLAYAGLVRLGEKRVPQELSWRALPRDLVAGMVAGGALFGMIFAILWLSGAYVVSAGVWSDWPHDLRETIGTGLLEELLARAIIFRLLARAFGLRWAFALSAAAFGAAHLGNDHASPFAAVAIAVEAGLMLAGFYVLTGRLWMSVGAHAAWNFMQGAVFGARVSGIEGSGSLLVSHPAACVPDWWSGGAFGPEASLPAIAVGLSAFAATMLYRRHLMAHPLPDAAPA